MVDSLIVTGQLVKQELNIPMSYDQLGSVDGYTVMKIVQVLGNIAEVKCRESIDGKIDPTTQYFVGSVASKEALQDGIEAVKFKTIIPNFRLVFQEQIKGEPYLFPGFVAADAGINIRKPAKSKY